MDEPQAELPSPGHPDDRPWSELARKAGRWAPLGLIAATFAGMAWFSWGKWPDVQVDFGYELYVPWQLTQGKALARDIALGPTGPLSPYWNALLFAVFGTSLRVLVICNLALLALLTWMLHVAVRELTGRFAATLASLAFLTIFAFGQYVGFGNYNYVAPYSHGITHGLFLSLLGILLMHRCVRTGAPRFLAGSAACLGLVFLTKPEIFVPCATALALPLALRLRRAPGRAAREIPVFAAAALAPTLGAFLLLLLKLPPSLAWQATISPWLLMATSKATSNPFYLKSIGLDHPGENIGLLAAWVGLYALVLVPAALLDRYSPARRTPRIAIAAAAFAAVLASLVALLQPERLYSLARPLPLVALAGCAAYAWRLLARRDSETDPPRLVLGVMLSAFSFALLLKMILNARIHNYGFALAMPAFVLGVAWLCGSVPAWLRAHGGAGVVFRSVSVALVAVVAVAFLKVSAGEFAHKVYPVGSGADAFLADERGPFVSEMIRRLPQYGGPEATLAALPDGVMINYLARRANPSPYLGFLADMAWFYGSEAPLFAALQKSPPDLILLVHRDSGEHGAQFFGRDYARSTMAWILANYTPVSVVGALPLLEERYGLLLLARNP